MPPPGEPLIEYQQHVQEIGNEAFVCVAGYGDVGMGYIPTDTSLFKGGYETTAPAPSRSG